MSDQVAAVGGREQDGTGPGDQPGPVEAAATFTVVVPLYNKARYVGQAVASVLAQTWREVEVIVVDDGSTDGGADIVAAIGDPRVRLVRQANAGVSAARNRGIALARGNWVAFLDADDWQHPDYLDRLRKVQRMHPEVDAVATRYLEVRDNEAPAHPLPTGWQLPAFEPRVELIRDLPARWMKGPSLFTGSIAIRRATLQRLEPCFVPGESFGEDLDVWFRVAELTPIALAHVPLVAYRTAVQGSLTRKHGRRALPPWVQRMHTRAGTTGFDPRRRKSTLHFIAQLKLNMARDALRAGCRPEGLQWLVSALHALPSRRWWLTAFMVCFWPQTLVDTFIENRRSQLARQELHQTLAQPAHDVQAGLARSAVLGRFPREPA